MLFRSRLRNGMLALVEVLAVHVRRVVALESMILEESENLVLGHVGESATCLGKGLVRGGEEGNVLRDEACQLRVGG